MQAGRPQGETLAVQAEKTVSKMGAFFKNAFQKIEDSFNNTTTSQPPPAKPK